ncbi:MAG: carbon-nitrogen hydrolase family protein [Pseudooceanicola sp.]
MKVAAAAYPLDWFDAWSGYEEKLSRWVAEAAGAGAELLVFPEYGAMELVSLAGETVAADTRAAMRAVSERMEEANALHRDLAARHGVHILGGSASVEVEESRFVNRAHLHTHGGATAFQDKLIMTLWERDPMRAEGQGPLKLFDTSLGLLAVNICYDGEFPLFARAQAAADLLLVPSTTEREEGYWRVRIGAQARALENQCVAVMSSTVGPYPRLELMETSFGAGGVFGPPDRGFPANGVLAAGAPNRPGWIYAEVDVDTIRAVREGGNVRNRRHWEESEGLPPPERIDLR